VVPVPAKHYEAVAEDARQFAINAKAKAAAQKPPRVLTAEEEARMAVLVEENAAMNRINAMYKFVHPVYGTRVPSGLELLEADEALKRVNAERKERQATGTIQQQSKSRSKPQGGSAKKKARKSAATATRKSIVHEKGGKKRIKSKAGLGDSSDSDMDYREDELHDDENPMDDDLKDSLLKSRMNLQQPAQLRGKQLYNVPNRRGLLGNENESEHGLYKRWHDQAGGLDEGLKYIKFGEFLPTHDIDRNTKVKDLLDFYPLTNKVIPDARVETVDALLAGQDRSQDLANCTEDLIVKFYTEKIGVLARCAGKKTGEGEAWIKEFMENGAVDGLIKFAMSVTPKYMRGAPEKVRAQAIEELHTAKGEFRTYDLVNNPYFDVYGFKKWCDKWGHSPALLGKNLKKRAAALRNQKDERKAFGRKLRQAKREAMWVLVKSPTSDMSDEERENIMEHNSAVRLSRSN
jgi:hypothetical protein